MNVFGIFRRPPVEPSLDERSRAERCALVSETESRRRTARSTADAVDWTRKIVDTIVVRAARRGDRCVQVEIPERLARMWKTVETTLAADGFSTVFGPWNGSDPRGVTIRW